MVLQYACDQGLSCVDSISSLLKTLPLSTQEEQQMENLIGKKMFSSQSTIEAGKILADSETSILSEESEEDAELKAYKEMIDEKKKEMEKRNKKK